jgi:hypothetical protein
MRLYRHLVSREACKEIPMADVLRTASGGAFMAESPRPGSTTPAPKLQFVEKPDGRGRG